MLPTGFLPVTSTLVLALLLPTSLSGQAGPTAVGALLGTAGGAYLSLALTTAAARAGHYAYSPGQAIWLLTPVPVGAVAGGIVGHQGEARLRDAAQVGLVGFAAGAAVGAVLGNLAWDGSEGAWSGALIGSGVGLLVGSVWGALLRGGDSSQDAPTLPALTLSIPFGP